MNDQSNMPTHDVLTVKQEGRKSYYRKIGVAWPSKDGKGFNIELEAHPIGSTLLIRVPLPPKDAGVAQDPDDRPAYGDQGEEGAR